MAKKLFRLALSATARVDASPSAQNFIKVVSAQTLSAGVALTIKASSFENDNGTVISPNGKFPTAAVSNGYYMLFWGGVLQHKTVYTIDGTGSAISFTFDAEQKITNPTPVTLSVINFTPKASITIIG